jgi:cell wall-associated protease
MLALAACTLTTAELKALLLDSVDPVAALAAVTSTGGRLNAGRTVTDCEYPRVTAATVTANKTAPQPPGTAITWTATATGGEAPLQYRFVLFDGTATTNLTGWTTSNTYVWTPAQSNSAYTVSVRVRSAWNTGSAELISSSVAFPVRAVVTSLSLTGNLTAPQPTGTAITWTAAATGGIAPLQYRWLVYDGSAYTVLREWSSATTFVWTPTVANDDYAMVVRARSAGSSVNYEAVATEAFAIKPGITSASVSADKAAPQTPGTTITWTATAAGGEAPLEYRFVLFDGTTTTNLTAWTTSDTYAWTPAQSNNAYAISVRVRSAWNAGSAERISSSVAFPVRAVVTNLTLTPSVAAPQGLGTSITWTATATGGVAPYQYRFQLQNGTILRDWSSTNTLVWTPTVADDNYAMTVRARSAGNTSTFERATTEAFAIKPKVTGATLTADKTAPQAPGTTITWTATGAGGEAPLEYRFVLFDGTTTTNLTAWTTTNTYAWTPAQANSAYAVSVRVRSGWNAGSAEYISPSTAFAIRPFVTSLTLTPNRVAPQAVGTAITWTATASGGVAPYQYRFQLQDGTILRDWSSSNTLIWTPTVANNGYVMTVRARSAGNTGAFEKATTEAFAITP